MTRQLAALGFGLTAAMQLIFLLSGQDRPIVYGVLQAVAFTATVVATWSVLAMPRAEALFALSASLGAFGVVRGLMAALGLSRLYIGLNALMVIGFGLAAYGAAKWSQKPEARSRAGVVRVGVGLAGVAFFGALISSFSGGSLTAMIGIALGTLGLALAAPHIDVPEPQATPEPQL